MFLFGAHGSLASQASVRMAKVLNKKVWHKSND